VKVNGRDFKSAIFEQLARVGTVFDSPKRVEIIDLLAQADRSVESIATATAMTVANTSRHLQILRQAGMVLSRREGSHVVYRVADESVIAGYIGLRRLAESRIAEVSQLAEAFFGEVDGAESIGIDELLTRSRAGEVVVIDVRPSLEFEASHLQGALSIPLEELSRRLGELDPNTSVVAYCRGPYCVMAAEAVAQLRAAGLQAHRFAEGPLEWDTTKFNVDATTGAKSHSKHSLIEKQVTEKKKGATK
jgi:rhodanese-related sulfurtransferase/DNA-binding transcriptional ArsR family regulator